MGQQRRSSALHGNGWTVQRCEKAPAKCYKRIVVLLVVACLIQITILVFRDHRQVSLYNLAHSHTRSRYWRRSARDELFKMARPSRRSMLSPSKRSSFALDD